MGQGKEGGTRGGGEGREEEEGGQGGEGEGKRKGRGNLAPWSFLKVGAYGSH